MDETSMCLRRKIIYCIVISSPAWLAIAGFIFRIHDSIWSINPWYAFVIALSIVFAGTFVFLWLLQRSREKAETRNKELLMHTHCDNIYKGSFSDIIRDGNYYASLPRFQFLLWTFVISFTFASVYLIRIAGGESGFPTQIPNEILALMGISVIVPAISTPLSAYKYDTTLAQKPPCKEEITHVSDMLIESGKPALFRYQMFLWTLIGIGIYLLLFFSIAITTINDVQKIEACRQLDIMLNSTSSINNRQNIIDQFNNLNCEPLRPFTNQPLKAFSLPNIDPSFVILMGLSQGGYLTGKLVARTPIKIARIMEATDNSTLTIFGSGFLTGGIVVIDGHRQNKEPSKWSDTMIEISVDEPTLRKWRIIEVITNESTQAKYQREGPTVTYLYPSDRAEDVLPTTRKIVVGFSEPMQEDSITVDKFKLKGQGNRPITIIQEPNFYKGENNTAEFTLAPDQELSQSTTYKAMIHRSVTNKELRIPMKKDKEWSFKTGK